MSFIGYRHRTGTEAVRRYQFYLDPSLSEQYLVLGVGGQDVRVTGIEDSHGGATEELTAGGTELDLFRHVSLQLSEVVFRPLLRANPQSIPRVSVYLVVRP